MKIWKNSLVEEEYDLGSEVTFWYAWRNWCCVVFDGFIISMLKTAGVKSFHEYIEQVFISYISSQLHCVSHGILTLMPLWKAQQEPSMVRVWDVWEGSDTRKLANLSIGWQQQNTSVQFSNQYPPSNIFIELSSLIQIVCLVVML